MEPEEEEMKNIPEKIKKQYRNYWVKFGFRVLVLLVTVWIAVFRPEELTVLEGMNFFRHFSVLHLLWLLWAWYMLEKLLPSRNRRPKGCRKHRKEEFQPTKEYEDWVAEGKPKGQTSLFWQEFCQERKQYGKGAGMVLGGWALAAIGILILRQCGVLGSRELLIGSTLFYVGDLVCILIWCPFRDVFMKNRCCTKCRIYNWDTGMLILPVLYIPGFFSYSLLVGALMVVGSWELAHLWHPERFYSVSNAALQCRNCGGELGCSSLQIIKLNKNIRN